MKDTLVQIGLVVLGALLVAVVCLGLFKDSAQTHVNNAKVHTTKSQTAIQQAKITIP